MLIKVIVIVQYLKFYYNSINNNIPRLSSLLYSIPIACKFVTGFTNEDEVVANGEKNSL